MTCGHRNHTGIVFQNAPFADCPPASSGGQQEPGTIRGIQLGQGMKKGLKDRKEGVTKGGGCRERGGKGRERRVRKEEAGGEGRRCRRERWEEGGERGRDNPVSGYLSPEHSESLLFPLFLPKLLKKWRREKGGRTEK